MLFCVKDIDLATVPETVATHKLINMLQIEIPSKFVTFELGPENILAQPNECYVSYEFFVRTNRRKDRERENKTEIIHSFGWCRCVCACEWHSVPGIYMRTIISMFKLEHNTVVNVSKS